MFYNWLNNSPKDLALVLEKKGIEKDRFSRPKGSTRRSYGQPVKEPVDWLPSSDRRPVEGCTKIFSLSQWPSLPGRGHSRPDQGSVEATVTCQALNAPMASKPVDP